ncbi:hypothetical protein JB92DRAFT_3124491 [Gautieria morchelliformis]|nr:hypothetical protein JB92DRAFT_3124491 [Gautieria morchelliformis]
MAKVKEDDMSNVTAELGPSLLSIVDKHPDTDVGVCFCGPPVLSKTSHVMYTKPKVHGFSLARFVRHADPPSICLGQPRLNAVTYRWPLNLFVTPHRYCLRISRSRQRVRLTAEQPSKATFEVLVRPLSGISNTDAKSFSTVLRTLLAPCLVLTQNPGTLIQPVVQSLT